MTRLTRHAALFLAFSFALTGCGGGGGRALLGGGNPSGNGLPGGSSPSSGSRQIAITLTIPSSSASAASAVRKPATISAQTASITVTVNGGTPQVFNLSSCSGTPLVCTLSVGANYGLDSFLIQTYSGSNGSGTALNAAVVTLNVAPSGPNTASATAGNIVTVTSSADGSGASYSCASGSTTCTLREAIATANSAAAGTTTAILFSGVSSITLSSGNINVDNNVVIIGPGASVANPSASGAPTASSGLTINGGSAAQIFYVPSGVSFTVSGLTLSGDSGSNGGGILNLGTLTVYNTIFSNNTVTGDGGGIYNQGSGMTILASSFSGNTAPDGGAIFDDGNAGTTIAFSSFTNGTANYGGAIYWASASTETIVDTTFSGNTANNAGAYGGALSLWGTGTVTVASDTFSNNVSYEPVDGFADGGAIYADSGTLIVNNSTFTNNVAGNATTDYSGGNTGYGGAIATEWDDDGTPTVTITNSTFTGNYTGGPGTVAADTGQGGAVFNGSCNPITLSGNTFKNNKAQGASWAYGGAIADFCGALVSGGSGVTADTFTSNTADASACTEGECGYSGGGAVYMEDVATFIGATFKGNQSLGGDDESDGGAITSNENLTATNASFSNNLSSDPYFATGGGLTAYSSTVTLTNVQFSSNTATATAPSDEGPGAVGGGMSSNDVSLAFSGVTFTSNTSSAPQGGMALGGGLAEEYADCSDCSHARRPAPQSSAKTQQLAGVRKWAANIAALQTKMAQFATAQQALRARHVNGKARVAVAARASSATTRKPQQEGFSSTLSNVTFTSNTANGGPSGFAYGGGADLSGTPTITGATFTSNGASASGGFAAGGGISYSASACGTALTFTGSVTGNSALSQGGGMAINPSGGLANGCSATISQTTISSNSVTGVSSAGQGGGGLQCFCTLMLTQSTLANNSVAGNIAGSGGGGLLGGGNNPAQTVLTILNSTIAFNTAATDGGGALNAGSDDYGAVVVLQNDTIYKNTATNGKGGNAIEYANGGYNLILFQNTIFAGGSAPADTDTNDVWNGDPVWSLNYNLVGQSSTTSTGSSICGLTGSAGHCANDMSGTLASPINPQLASGLASNGGPTQTIADTSSSPGKGYIPFAAGACNTVTTYLSSIYTGPGVDQRGYTRGAGGVCDIGAFEFAGVAP